MNEIYLIETRALNTVIMERIARLKFIAAIPNSYAADAAKRLIIKYGY